MYHISLCALECLTTYNGFRFCTQIDGREKCIKNSQLFVENFCSSISCCWCRGFFMKIRIRVKFKFNEHSFVLLQNVIYD